MTDYVCILDFEALCWEDKRFPNEIIEFPSVLLKWEENQLHDISKKKKYTIREVARIQLFVKPAVNPFVSDFCTELTGITQKQVDDGIDLKSAIETHLNWIKNIAPTDKVTIATHGDWDLKIMLPMDLKNISYEPDEIYTRYVNIKDIFHILEPKKKGMGMIKMLGHLGLKPNGRHHSGIDDCHNIGRIFSQLVDKGLDKKMFANNVKPVNQWSDELQIIKHIYRDYFDEQDDVQKHKKVHNKKHNQKYNKNQVQVYGKKQIQGGVQVQGKVQETLQEKVQGQEEVHEIEQNNEHVQNNEQDDDEYNEHDNLDEYFVMV